jgi:manganese/zinc/iron transport system ATP- binding protein
VTVAATPGGRPGVPPAGAPGPGPGPGDATPAIRLTGVSVGYGSRAALSDVDLAIPAGSLLAVIGPNGAGKSTLLKTIAGLLTPFSGSVEVLGGPPRREARRIAYVPQAELVDWAFPVTVGDVVMMGRVPLIGIGRSPGQTDRQAVHQALETVAMADLVDRQVGQLSGGQRRRVFLARALAARPDLYLLDEPVTGVDVTTQEDLMAILEAESQAGRTIVATTHDLASAAHHFHQVAFINGRIVAYGPADLVMDPALLATTYGGHVIVLPSGEQTVIDDAHHHDQPPGGERHFHDEPN